MLENLAAWINGVATALGGNHLGPSGVSPQVVAAVATAIIAVTAWFAKSFVEFLAWSIRRRWRKQEIVRALRAEVIDTVKTLNDLFSVEAEKRIMARFDDALQKGSDYSLFWTTGGGDFLFGIIKADLIMLDGSLINEITQYHYRVQYIFSAMAETRNADFKALSVPRRKAFFQNVYNLARGTVHQGFQLLAATNPYLPERAPTYNALFPAAEQVENIRREGGSGLS